MYTVYKYKSIRPAWHQNYKTFYWDYILIHNKRVISAITISGKIKNFPGDVSEDTIKAHWKLICKCRSIGKVLSVAPEFIGFN